MQQLNVMKIVAEKAKAVPFPGDFRDPDTGLLTCIQCGKPKECIVTWPDGQKMTVGCMCDCAAKAYEDKAARAKAARTENLRIKYIKDPAMREKRFDRSKDSDLLRRVRAYVEDWENVKANNGGLVFYGPPGSGKTHISACIVNGLIDQDVPATIMSIPQLMLLPYGERNETILRNVELPLLVIDDLGTERDTSYGRETVYSIIDGRLNSGNPMIITTNLSLEEMETPGSVDSDRIYGRILEACHPVKVMGKNYRLDVAAKKAQFASKYF